MRLQMRQLMQRSCSNKVVIANQRLREIHLRQLGELCVNQLVQCGVLLPEIL
jgi:hypothetical protein